MPPHWPPHGSYHSSIIFTSRLQALQRPPLHLEKLLHKAFPDPVWSLPGLTPSFSSPGLVICRHTPSSRLFRLAVFSPWNTFRADTYVAFSVTSLASLLKCYLRLNEAFREHPPWSSSARPHALPLLSVLPPTLGCSAYYRLTCYMFIFLHSNVGQCNGLNRVLPRSTSPQKNMCRS